jgi:alpha-maltose-1-phosphate synthase
MDVKKLKIAIVTSGRFHVADLAREFTAAGHQVRFYSMVPDWRLRAFGLNVDIIRSMFVRLALPLLAERIVARLIARDVLARRLTIMFDRLVANKIEQCDVLIGMSGIALEAALAARRRWGAKIYIERGSRHILSQREILSKLPNAQQVTDWQVQRELACYAIADVVTVLSRHCEESFLQLGFAPERLFRNPLGVSVQDFPLVSRRLISRPTILFAGTWCLRKGADLYAEAAKRMPDVDFLHVGSIGDFAIPRMDNFEHIAKVDQRELTQVYALASVFCLPSREEGLATVIPQALSSGLRVVCSDRTGGEDLLPLLQDKHRMTIFPTDDVTAMILALRAQIDGARTENESTSTLSREGAEFLSWRASAARYAERLRIGLHD